MNLVLLVILVASVIATSESRGGDGERRCGWELMQILQIPIPKLGDWYAEQTGDRSLCVLQDDGSEYCTCIYECGNGVWRSPNETNHHSWRHGDKSSMWEWESGCKKYCHVGVCDGQG
ncbi:hypothetical protein ACET3X_002505 [Alternaria dauci]|uniref:Uncharacterized protein n=1 Tax=Alternaria dauci TaxID=48095 RepID=A0ABR3UPR3_9PLEO